ncbi:MAG TPA: NepR family anti-sigma factor [Nitrobacter sp.]|jgi:hypothetical protein|nr:NepR family anti-sigma factor [Nitrobacter sp.]
MHKNTLCAEDTEYRRATQIAIGRAMRASYEALLTEPLPDRIVTLLERLAEVDEMKVAKAGRLRPQINSNDQAMVSSA